MASASTSTLPPIANDDPDDTPSLSITMLGAGQEVGRSCCVIKHRGKVIVCDVGLHPANNGISALPFIDELDWSTVDAILVTHFHVDHAAGLPYVMEKTNFKEGKGKVYMTHATKAIFRLTMQDAVRIGDNSADSSDRLYSEADLDSAWQTIIPVDYHQDILISGGLRFTPYHAGHVLGACMFMIEIAGVSVLYTGDYSREEDRHLVPAEVPVGRPDVMICESTFGVHTMTPRKDKEEQFTTLVSNIVRRGGRCLMPISAFGNVQELLLLLDEYWEAHPELQHVPVLYASGLAYRGMQVYRTYIHTMNAHIRSRFSKNRNDNPFAFKHVRNLKDFRKWEDNGPCVMMATPQMLQGYQSRELLEKWAPERKNGLIITGYSIDGTMAKNLLKQPNDFIGSNGQKIHRNMSVDEISFSAHVDFAQASAFIKEVNPQHIVLVHGEASVMGRLRAALQSQFANTDVKVHTPRNAEPLTLSLRTERIVKVIGSLASAPPTPGQTLSGLLVQKDFSYTLLHPSELKDFTGLSTTEVRQRRNLRLRDEGGGQGWERVRWRLEGMFGTVVEGVVEGRQCYRIMDCINIFLVSTAPSTPEPSPLSDSATDTKPTPSTSGHILLQLEWLANVSNDLIADGCLAVLCGSEKKRQGSPQVEGTNKKARGGAHHPLSDHASKSDSAGSLASSSAHERKATSTSSLPPSSDTHKILSFLHAHFGEASVSTPLFEEVEGREDELLLCEIGFEGVSGPSARDAANGGGKGVGREIVKVDLIGMVVSSPNAVLRQRVASVLSMALTTISSLSSSFRGVGTPWPAQEDASERASAHGPANGDAEDADKNIDVGLYDEEDADAPVVDEEEVKLEMGWAVGHASAESGTGHGHGHSCC